MSRFLPVFVVVLLPLALGACFSGGGGGGGEGALEPGGDSPGSAHETDPQPSFTSDPPEMGPEGTAGGGAEEPMAEPEPEPEPVEPEPAPEPSSTPFGISVQPADCALSSSVRLTTADGLDITPGWTGCWIVWGGEMGEDGTVTSGVRVMLMPPNVTGSLAYPGARWLSVSIPGGEAGSFPATRSRGYEGEGAGVVFVDTDDPAEAEAVDLEELFSQGPFDTTLLDGINWSGVGGQVQLTSLSGSVTSINPDDGFLDDEGLVEVSIDLAELTLSLLDGTEVNASGTLTASGQVGDGSTAGEPAPGGTTAGTADCDQLWGLPDDIQIYSQCQTACVYDDSLGLPENQDETTQDMLRTAIEGSCAVLEGFDPSYRASCPFCS